MQASSLKESNVDTMAGNKVAVGPGEAVKQKPPAINQGLTNKVFSDIDQMNAQSKKIADQDRNGINQTTDMAGESK